MPAPVAIAPKPAQPEPFRDIVIAGKRTAAGMHGAVGLGDGTFVVLACISASEVDGDEDSMFGKRAIPSGDSNIAGWPSGEALVRFDRTGKVIARRPVNACTGTLLRAGKEIVLVQPDQRGAGPVGITRFDPATLDVTRTATYTSPGFVETAVARPDGSIAIAALVDTFHPSPGEEVAFVAPDGGDLGHWRLLGPDIRISALVPDGNDVMATGIVRRDAKLDDGSEIALATTTESVFVAHLGAGPGARWAKLLGSRALGTISYEAPKLVAVAGGYALAWSVQPFIGDTRVPHPELDVFGGMPEGQGEHVAYARLDRDGTIVRAHLEPAGFQDAVLSLQVMPDGSVLEQRTHHVDFDYTERDEMPAECRGPHGCAGTGTPRDLGHIDSIVARRRDATTLAKLGEAQTGGEAAMLEPPSLIVDGPHDVIAVGSFIGTLALPRGKVSSTRHFVKPCPDSSRHRNNRDLFGSPPIDRCRVEVSSYAVLFAVRLTL